MIEVKGLYKGYDSNENYVVKDMNIHVEKGTIHGLIGHNGSGKTTIIKCLTGIYPPDKGEALIKGKPVYENPAIKEIVGYVADSNQMFTGYKISQLAKMYDDMYINFSMDDFKALNRIFCVNLNKTVNQLSKGQQMRASFMLNMARNPEVMILDEPTSGLDAIAKNDLLDCLVSAVENQGMTVLISSHHLSELEKICDSVTVIKNGQVHVDDDLDGVTGQVVKYQVVFPEGAPSELYQRGDVIHMSNVGSVYTVIVPKSAVGFSKDMSALGAVLVEEMQVGLEESFVYMNKKNMGGGAHE